MTRYLLDKIHRISDRFQSAIILSPKSAILEGKNGANPAQSPWLRHVGPTYGGRQSSAAVRWERLITLAANTRAGAIIYKWVSNSSGHGQRLSQNKRCRNVREDRNQITQTKTYTYTITYD